MTTILSIKKVRGLANILERLGVPAEKLKPVRNWADEQEEKLAPAKAEEAAARAPAAEAKPHKEKPDAIPAGKFWCFKCEGLHFEKKQDGKPHPHFKKYADEESG